VPNLMLAQRYWQFRISQYKFYSKFTKQKTFKHTKK